MYDVHFERFEDIDFDNVLRHPLAEEVDDYNAYKRCCREQRDAERHGTIRLGCLNYQTDKEMNLSESDFQEQFRRPSVTAKAKANDTGYVLPEGEMVSRSPSFMHRDEVTDFVSKRRTYDGSAEDSPRFHKVDWNPPPHRGR